MPLMRRRRPVIIGFALVQIEILSALLDDVFDCPVNAPDGFRAENEIDALDFVEQSLALELRDAAHNADERFRAVGFANLPDARIKFVFGFFAHRTGIQ